MEPRDVIRRIEEIEAIIALRMIAARRVKDFMGDALDELQAWREELERQELADCFVRDRRAA